MRMTWKTQQAMQDDDIRAARIHLALIPVTVTKCSAYGKIFSSPTEIPVGKTEISGTKSACTLKWTHLKVYKGFRGKARSRKLGSCEEAPSVCKVSPTIMDKSLGTLTFLGRFIIHTGITPPLTPQTMLDACIQNCFPKFKFVKGGERENCMKI